MAYCLKAPSHYLNQCQFTISEVQWHSLEGSFIVSAKATNFLYNDFESHMFKIIATSHRVQWIKYTLKEDKMSPILHSQYQIMSNDKRAFIIMDLV